jgi:hypothetical protein
MGRNSTPVIKLYGERNSGTLYFYELLHVNLKARVIGGTEPPFIWKCFKGEEDRWTYHQLANLYFLFSFSNNLGWKHMLVLDPPGYERFSICRKNFLFVTITKNPYSWLLSLYRRPYGSRRRFAQFEDFLAAPWKTLWRERALRQYSNPMMLWNAKNDAYRVLAKQWPVVNLRYEDVLSNPEACVQQVANAGSISRKTKFFINRERSTKTDTGMVYQEYYRYYLQEKWKEKLSERAISLINRSLDPRVMRAYGYDLLPCKDAS